jgi:DNA-binding transcriptional LysR family regulator
MRAVSLQPNAIELRHLRYFLVVSEELHFRRAAERLHMSQPPLSHAIQKLESELGVRLLDRTSRTVALTEAGRVFAAEARKVLARFDLAVTEGRRVGGGEFGVQIGFAPYLKTDLLFRFLNGLQERKPQLRPEVKHLLGLEQVRRLQRGELDLGIFSLPNDVPMLQTAALYPGEPLSALLMPDHPLAAKTVLGPDDLTTQTLVAAVGDQNRTDPKLVDWLHELERHGYRFRELHEVNEVRDCILAVAAGIGIALLPDSALTDGDASTIIIRRPLDPPLLWPDTVVAWRRRPTGQVKAVIREVRELAHALRETTDQG